MSDCWRMVLRYASERKPGPITMNWVWLIAPAFDSFFQTHLITQ